MMFCVLLFIFRITHQMKCFCSGLQPCTFLLAHFLVIVLRFLIQGRRFCIIHAFGTNESFCFTKTVPLPILKSFNIYFNNGTFFTRKALIVSFCGGVLF